nr:immunoglobulin heavy chain junction region [Mus musculus]
LCSKSLGQLCYGLL